MQISQIRREFLNYFERQHHIIVPSSQLVPHNDPTLMFTNSGMVQFKNYFTGIEVSPYKRAASSQKCLRAGGKHNDLENVGYTARHHTFFEMLGNFSFGDYFKEEAIEFAWRFLTKELMLSAEKLYITIYHDDNESWKIWKKLTGFQDEKIIKINSNDNFWSMGDTGPCGPCSEIFYDHGEKYWGGLPGTAEADGDRYVEIWNLVFMQYEQLLDGSRIALPKPCIDTGMGLERVSAVLQGTNHNYETDIFKNLIKASQELSKNTHDITSHRVIADHLRSSAFLIADGIMPANEGRGYVLRRIMRRAMRHIHLLNVKEPMMYKLVSTLVSEMSDAYPELKRAEPIVTATLKLEEEKFHETLERGLKLLNSNISSLSAGDELSGELAFKLYDTYGFPLDLTKDILKSHNIAVDEEGFEKEMYAQKQRARAAWVGSGEKATDEIWFHIYDSVGATEFLGYHSNEAEAIVKAIIVDGNLVDKANDTKAIIVLNQTPFYAESGGQVGDTGMLNQHQVIDTKKYASNVFGHIVELKGEVKVGDVVHAKIDVIRRAKIRANHSATHILHHILRQHLGHHVMQKGSIVTAEKLRFDFSHPEPLTMQQIQNIEQEVNNMIISNHEVMVKISSQKQAIESGAVALFEEKYGEEVRTIRMGDSFELCGGTHVIRTGDIGLFKITSEESISSGVRRIEAVTALAALNYINSWGDIINNLAHTLKCSERDIEFRVQLLIEEKRKAEKEQAHLRLTQVLNDPIAIEHINGINFIAKKLEGMPPADLKNIANAMLKKIVEGVVLISNITDGRISILIYVSKNLLSKYRAQALVQETLEAIDGKGGGNAEIAQSGGGRVEGLDKAIANVKSYILTH